MANKKFFEQIPAYFEGDLSEDEQKEFLKELSSDPELEKILSVYKDMRETETKIQSRPVTAPADLTNKVMKRISTENVSTLTLILTAIKDILIGKHSRYIVGAVATCSLAFMILVVADREGARLSTKSFYKESGPIDASGSNNKEELRPGSPKSEPHEPPELRRDTDSKSRVLAPIAAAPKESKKNYSSELGGKGERAGGAYNQPQLGKAPRVEAQISQEQFDSLSTADSVYMGSGQYDLGTEQYVAVEENRRTATSNESISTFSIDVDTASYSNARRYINLGQLPPKDSVRVEEFLNYFDYQYESSGDKIFSITKEIAPSPIESGHHILRVGIKAKDIKPSDEGWNLAFLIDVSGSMNAPNKLPLLKSSMQILVNQMRPQDRVAIVTYAGNAGLVLDSTSLEHKQQISKAIDSLSPGGSTNGAAGIDLAYKVLESNFVKGGVNRVILATDGDFNVGTTSRSELIKLIEKKRQSGITLTTLGLGYGNLNDATMEQLADKGNGNYFYIDSIKEARKIFETELFGTIEVVAKDVKTQIEFNPKFVKSYRLMGYDNRALQKEDFNDDSVDAGEIGSGHTVTALYDLVLNDSDLPQSMTDYRYKQNQVAPESDPNNSEIAFIKIRYKEPHGTASQLITVPALVSEIESSQSTSRDFKFATAVVAFAENLRGGLYSGKLRYQEIVELAKQGLGNDNNGSRKEFIELAKSVENITRPYIKDTEIYPNEPRQ